MKTVLAGGLEFWYAEETHEVWASKYRWGQGKVGETVAGPFMYNDRKDLITWLSSVQGAEMAKMEEE